VEQEVGTSGCQVPRVSVRELSARGFAERFGDPCLPVLLLDIVPKWPAFQEWRCSDGKPDFKALSNRFGSCHVPVHVCAGVRNCASPPEELGYGEADISTWAASDYFSWASEWSVRSNGAKALEGKLLYLKDWHFVKTCEEFRTPIPYNVPDYLSSALHDWLNLYWDVVRSGENDFRFCYVGVANTATALHHDVLLSHSWSANICGRKRWILFPPDVTQFLVDRRGEVPADATPGRRPAGWESRFPRLDEAWARHIEVVQEPGELMFVPGGWYHQVTNLTDAVSINHNWISPANALQAWKFLQSELSAARRAIDDVRDTFESLAEFETKCQELMRQNCGMDYAGWLALIRAAGDEVEKSLVSCASGSQCAGEEMLVEDLEDRRWACQWAATRLGEVIDCTLSDMTISHSCLTATFSDASSQLDSLRARLPRG